MTIDVARSRRLLRRCDPESDGRDLPMGGDLREQRTEQEPAHAPPPMSGVHIHPEDHRHIALAVRAEDRPRHADRAPVALGDKHDAAGSCQPVPPIFVWAVHPVGVGGGIGRRFTLQRFQTDDFQFRPVVRAEAGDLYVRHGEVTRQDGGDSSIAAGDPNRA